MTILLDAAGTLIHPAEGVGEVYARTLRSVAGLAVDSAAMHRTFLEVFSTAQPPEYGSDLPGHAAEDLWWRELVAAILRKLGPEAEAFASTGRDSQDAADPPSGPEPRTFDTFFRTLFRHYAQPSAWTLYPEVPDFLEGASALGPLAVVSNFDDRLAPILDGLGIGPFFEHIVTSADARVRKPHRGIFDLALDRLNAAPGETHHCGDSHHADYEGARAAGMHAFHLDRSQHTLLDFLELCQGRRNSLRSWP